MTNLQQKPVIRKNPVITWLYVLIIWYHLHFKVIYLTYLKSIKQIKHETFGFLHRIKKLRSRIRPKWNRIWHNCFRVSTKFSCHPINSSFPETTVLMDTTEIQTTWHAQNVRENIPARWYVTSATQVLKKTMFIFGVTFK